MGTSAGGAPRVRGYFGPAFEPVLSAAQAAEGWAYRQLFEAFAPPVAGYLGTQGLADVEGSTNEVFLRVFRALGTFEGHEDRFRSWVFTIAHNIVVDERRRADRRVREAPLPEEWGLAGPSVDAADAEALARIGEERVRELLDDLSPDQRDVLLLRIVADMTVEQTAASLSKTVGAVKQLQRRGLDAIRRRLAPWGVSL